MDSPSVEYAIDGQDRLIHFNGAWDLFAIANNSPAVLAENVKMRDLFDFISDQNVRQIWRFIIDRLRKIQGSTEFAYRCDAPDLRRFMTMRVSYHDGNLYFKSKVQRIEAGEGFKVLDASRLRNETLFVTCSWCRKFKVGEDLWLDPELAVSQLRLFEGDLLPLLSHGVCESCLTKILAENNLQ